MYKLIVQLLLNYFDLKLKQTCVTCDIFQCVLFQNFADCKTVLVERGNMYLKNVAGARDKIARLGHPFIRDGAVSQYFKKV